MTNYRIYEDFDGVKEEVITKEEEIEEFMNLPYDEQLRVYFQKGSRPMKRIVRYENSEKYLSLESVVGEVEFTGTKFFVKHSIGNKFLYKKENKKTFSRYDRDMLLRDLILFPRFDWIKNEYEKKHIHGKVLSNSVVRDILAGKLTNVEIVVKTYLKTLHLKDIDWKVYVKYLSTFDNVPVYWLKACTTDVNEAMKKIIEGQPYHFKDMVKQALSLGRTINPKWSEKRMDEEHTNMTHLLMKKEIDHKEQIPIYKECPVFDYPCHILNTEKEVFEEGLDMHHCIYTNYWSRIKNKNYIGLSFMEPERFTLGLKRTNGKFEFDQAYLKYDKKISPQSQNMINTFLHDKRVVEQINKLEENNPVMITSENHTEIPYEDVELPF